MAGWGYKFRAFRFCGLLTNPSPLSSASATQRTMIAMNKSSHPFLCIIVCPLLWAWLLTATPCFGEWQQTVHCPGGHIYRDIREDAGRQEFCDLELPGSLAVKDGPYRSWFSEGAPGSAGNYLGGREVGIWKECNRFDHCETKEYAPAFPEEKKRRAFRPEVPVSFQNGKYRFDFASCRSTWITHAIGNDPIELNIGGSHKYNCVISIFQDSVMDHGGEGSYTCWIPYSVGVRTFDSLDLLSEFPKTGLPQFCRPERTSPEPPESAAASKR